jgi:hypothetical protein
MAKMEFCQHTLGTPESSSGLDLVIVNLDEFAAGISSRFGCSTAADYVTSTPAARAEY